MIEHREMSANCEFGTHGDCTGEVECEAEGHGLHACTCLCGHGQPAEWLRGDWMETFTGRRFYPKDPRAADVAIEDIAHALSMLCRYGGHVQRFYSVAEHSVLMAQWIQFEHRGLPTSFWHTMALTALLHDATEAYVVDVPRPVKHYLPDYKAMEASVWDAIALKFGLPPVVPAMVKMADTRILLSERDALMPNTRYSWSIDGMEPLPVEVQGWDPATAEAAFLRCFNELVAR